MRVHTNSVNDRFNRLEVAQAITKSHLTDLVKTVNANNNKLKTVATKKELEVLSKSMDRGYGSKIKLFLAQLLVTIYLLAGDLFLPSVHVVSEMSNQCVWEMARDKDRQFPALNKELSYFAHFIFFYPTVHQGII